MIIITKYLIILQVIDAVTTYALLQIGFCEANPVVNLLINFVGPIIGLSITKLIAIKLIVFVHRQNNSIGNFSIVGLSTIYSVVVIRSAILIMLN